MRSRLRFLVDLLGGLLGRGGGNRAPTPDDDAEEVRRRLDETRERLKRETPPKSEAES